MQHIRPGFPAVALLASVFLLTVILQLLPAASSQASNDAAHGTAESVSPELVNTLVLSLFIGGAVLAILFVAAVLIRSARKRA
ncbi:MAG: hypothetical protein JWL94_1029 [Microbacteriaceae bacterium]|nr:hypothetical protein [Microbacteriaceae bacterium]HEV7956789.1 hypothetical protein [Marisediminicola sp.]